VDTRKQAIARQCLEGAESGAMTFPQIVGTLIEISITLAIAVPLGLLGAVFLHEIPGRFSQFVRTVVEAMTAATYSRNFARIGAVSGP